MSGAGSKLGSVASKAKTPLLAGGAALAGLAGGIAMNRRNSSKNPLRKMSAPSLPSLPKALKEIDLSKVDLSKVDFDKITDAAHRVRSFGEQVGEVADAAEKTRKKHN